MARYLVTTRRADRNSAKSALDAVANEPGITLINDTDPHMVTIEASHSAATQLREKLHDTHFVEPEIRRSMD
jgi:hypothetical protein